MVHLRPVRGVELSIKQILSHKAEFAVSKVSTPLPELITHPGHCAPTRTVIKYYIHVYQMYVQNLFV